MKTSNTKAQVFSLISILMTVVFILFFSSTTHVEVNKEAHLSATHIDRIDEVVADIDNFILMTVEHSAYKIFNFSIDYISNVSYFTDYPATFTSCLNKGWFYTGTHWVNCSYAIPRENNSLPAQLEELFTLIGAAYNLSINYSHFNATFGQRDPYAVYVNFTLFVDIEAEGFAWTRFVNLTKEVSILGITDPLTVDTSYERPIIVHPDEGELVLTASFFDDFLFLQEHINNSYYFKDRTGITFLERFENYALTDIFENRTVMGITSFVPAHVNIGTPEFNATSKVQHHYTSGYLFGADRLRRFNTDPVSGVQGFNQSLIIHRTYAEGYLRVPLALLSEVAGCCDENGCLPTCG